MTRLPALRSVAAVLAVLFAGTVPHSTSGADRPAEPITIRYEGTFVAEGHYAKPGDTRQYRSDQRFSTDGRDRVRVDWRIWEEGDSVREPETYILHRDEVYHRRSPGAPWFRLSGERARVGRLQALAGLPEQLLADAERQKGKVRPKVVVERGRLESYLIQHAHPRMGDVWDTVELTYDEDDLVPQQLTMKVFERDHNWTLAARRVEVDPQAVDDSLLQAPARFEEKRDDVPVGEPKIVPFAPGVWAAEMEDIDSRTLIVEFADYLAVIEWAVGSANGKRIVDAAHRRWPQKPIRYAFFSHHHPHYMGGIREAIAAGAVVVTTPGNVGVVNRAAHATFRLEPDRLAKKPVEPQIRTFTDQFEIADTTNQLVAINYGARSQHTDEFVIFWLPRQKILFEAEQGWFGTGATLRTGRRAAGLVTYLSERKLDVETIVQAWPMRDSEASLTRTRLEELVRSSAR